MKCSHCDSEAVTYIRYNGSHLCPSHFRRYVEKRVKKELRRQVELRHGDVISVAVSGGKDSMVTLHLLHHILKGKVDVEMHCISVDEGIAGYRPDSLLKVQALCDELDVPYHQVSFQELFQKGMDDIAPRAGDSSPCTYCGVLRRKGLNSKARELGSDYLATGLNLDDTVQSIMMNFTRGDVERLARMGPHVKVQEGLVPRIQPLRIIPEKESYLYALLSGLDFHDGTCPYADLALRNQYRRLVDELEDRSPGTRFSILSSYDTLAPMLRANHPAAQLHRCDCGEPCMTEKCKACQLLERF
ncbi:MAG: TIGR00269 family protein [Candidatus Methanomethylophilaceae archaeon]|nr:TIGR00269 family protein [Candidatus Methanomethylophilaceae archaeon]